MATYVQHTIEVLRFAVVAAVLFGLVSRHAMAGDLQDGVVMQFRRVTATFGGGPAVPQLAAGGARMRATRRQMTALTSRSSDALFMKGLLTGAEHLKGPPGSLEAAPQASSSLNTPSTGCPLTAEDFTASTGPTAVLAQGVKEKCDYNKLQGQQLCDECSCAIFNSLFELLAATGHNVNSIDDAINSCADQLWQGLMDSGVLPRRTQLYLNTCEPGDCSYSDAAAAVAALNVEGQPNTCPMTVAAFSTSPILRKFVQAACNDASLSGQELCNACSCAIFNGMFEALAYAGHSVRSIDATIGSCAENLWQGLLHPTALLSKSAEALLATCKPGDCTYSTATSAVVAKDVDYQTPGCPLSVKQFAASQPLRAAVVSACDAQQGRSGRALCKTCYCTALNAVYQSLKDAKADFSAVHTSDCVFRLWASVSINVTAEAITRDTAKYDTCQPFKALHLQCPAPVNSALHAVFYDEAKAIVTGLPATQPVTTGFNASDTAANASNAVVHMVDTVQCPLAAEDYGMNMEFRAAIRSACDTTSTKGQALCSRCYCAALQSAFVMEFRALSGNATAAQAHDWGVCHRPMLVGMQATGEVSQAVWATLQSCDLAAVLASCAMDDAHAESIEAIVGAWPADNKNMTRSLNITQFMGGGHTAGPNPLVGVKGQGSMKPQSAVANRAQGWSNVQLKFVVTAVTVLCVLLLVF